MNDWDGRRVLVVGTGKSGSAAARALLRHGAAVTVIDAATNAVAEAAAQGLRDAGATVRLGAATETVDPFDAVIPSPGVPQGHALLQAAAQVGVPVWSEPELAYRLNDGVTQVVGITGTNGKTTTTELTAACLQAPTAGNIGTPLVELLDGSDPPPVVVAELSSFQLRFTDEFRPHVAALLNVAPDHLDWHGDVAAYQEAKARIWRNQSQRDTAVLNADDDGAQTTAARHAPPGRTLTFTLRQPGPAQVGIDGGAIVANLDAGPVEVVGTGSLGIDGPHNLANACAAVAISAAVGAEVQDLAQPLMGYRAGRHRLEPVGTVGGVAYVNDSKATNPHAAAAALGSFGEGRVVWIAGGLGKGLTFEPLVELIRRHVHTAVTIGESGPQIAAVAREAGAAVVEAGTLDAAVTVAAQAATPGDTVLLAPACASMDQFRDYAARGDAFSAAVRRLETPVEGAGRGR